MSTKIRSLILLPVLFLIQHFFLINCSSQQSYNVNREGLSNLKVMTFNIRYGSANDNENSWDYRKGILFDLLRDHNSDIMGLQEAEKFQIDEILEELPGFSFVGYGRDDGKVTGEFSPILFSKQRFILDTTETFWFSHTPNIPGSISWGNKYTRICTWAKLFDKFSGNELYVFNVHLDHISENSRIKSSQALIDKIKTLDQLPIIITGDFNTNENEQTIKLLREFGLTDSYRTLHQQTGDEGTFNGFIGKDDGDRIDFVFVSKEYEPVKSMIDKSNHNGKYSSDHFPVISVLKYVEKK